ncbi:polysaccharide biosynthesis tyrosine autokinase [Erythrobacter sp.]|uniref:GumC family protein n=1 Tax=Erythrobacter sp. TaxID=1042 RepID=UPI0025E42999|nr:polysaccharide biosynthesis tyrosine autokinase [Erythrobacter sp.]
MAATAYGLVENRTDAAGSANAPPAGTSAAHDNQRHGPSGGGGGGSGGGSGGGGGAPFLPDPGFLWLVFRRRLWLFLCVVAGVLALVAAYTLTRPELYSATASVLIEPRQPEVLESDPVSPELASDTNVIDTEVEILSSRRLAGRVAEALRLHTWPQFAGARVPPTAADEPGTHPLAGAVLARMDIRRSGLTYLIDIKAEAETPELAAALANEYAKQYLAQQEDRKAGTSQEAQEFLQTRLTELRRNVAQADAALQNYMIRNGLMSAEGATMAEQEVSVLNQEISSARALLAEKEGQLAAARNRIGRGGGGAEVPAALQSGTVAQLRAREAELTGEVARLENRLGDQHPELRRARGELVDIRSQIQQQIDRVMSSLESDVQAARSRLASLEASQQRARGSLASNNSAQAGFLQLERDAEAARQIYETFLRRSQDVEAQSGLIRPDASIESLARVPVMPSSPSYPLATVGGLTLALILGFMAIGGAEYLDARIRTRNDVERRLGLAYAGAVPELDSTVKRSVRGELPYEYMLDHPQSKFTEAIRALKNTLLLGQGSAAGRSIAVTSALPREGKSTTAICLARLLADSGVRTVLVDCDSRRHAVSDAFLAEDWDGFGQYLRREVPLAQALAVDERTGLSVLGSRHADHNGRELFVQVPLTEMLDELALRFEVVVLDTAPVLGVAETRLIAAEVGQVLMLARWRDTSIKAAETAADLLLAADANLTGVALTRVDVRKYGSTGQQDVYSYHNKFAGYYVD